MLRFFEQIRRHAAIATGDFAQIFREIDIPPLPGAVAELLTQINQKEPDFERLALSMAGVPVVTAKILKTVNSAMYTLPQKVVSIRQAVALLGLTQVRSLAVAYLAQDIIPIPELSAFDSKLFWTDSLLRALVAQELANRVLRSDEAEGVFTASLLTNLALPVLISRWSEYYLPVLAEWEHSRERMSVIEDKHFAWNHAQAGAWIANSWNFPQDLVALIAVHALDWEKVKELQLYPTAAGPVIAASLLPSSKKMRESRVWDFIKILDTDFNIDTTELAKLLNVVEKQSIEMTEVLGLDAGPLLSSLQFIQEITCA